MTERLVSPPDARGRQVAVEFSWKRDRFTHQVSVGGADGWQSWLVADEGRAEDDWPASPPLQQLSVELREDGPVALLVGMAGRSHWSLSVETLPDGLRFDAACRVTDAPLETLGSRYRLIREAAGVVQTEPASRATESTAESDREPLLHITPREPAGPLVRWSYLLRSS